MLNKCKELRREVKFFTGYAWSLGEWIYIEVSGDVAILK